MYFILSANLALSDACLYMGIGQHFNDLSISVISYKVLITSFYLFNYVLLPRFSLISSFLRESTTDGKIILS